MYELPRLCVFPLSLSLFDELEFSLNFSNLCVGLSVG